MQIRSESSWHLWINLICYVKILPFRYTTATSQFRTLDRSVRTDLQILVTLNILLLRMRKITCDLMASKS